MESVIRLCRDHSRGRGLPTAPAGAADWKQFLYILLREAPGFLLIAVYFAVLPGLLAMTVFRKFFDRMGFVRYMVFSNLILMMAALPLKMLSRWFFNLKYIVYIPEYFLNL